MQELEYIDYYKEFLNDIILKNIPKKLKEIKEDFPKKTDLIQSLIYQRKLSRKNECKIDAQHCCDNKVIS